MCEIDNVIKQTFDIINSKDSIDIINHTDTIEELKNKVKENIIRLKDSNSLLNKQPAEGGDAFVVGFLLLHDLFKNFLDTDLEKFKNRLNTINQLLAILNKKN